MADEEGAVFPWEQIPAGPRRKSVTTSKIDPLFLSNRDFTRNAAPSIVTPFRYGRAE